MKLFSVPRENAGPDQNPFSYLLSWADDKGRAVKGSLSVDEVEYLAVLSTARPLVYNFTRRELMPQSQVSHLSVSGTVESAAAVSSWSPARLTSAVISSSGTPTRPCQGLISRQNL